MVSKSRKLWTYWNRIGNIQEPVKKSTTRWSWRMVWHVLSWSINCNLIMVKEMWQLWENGCNTWTCKLSRSRMKQNKEKKRNFDYALIIWISDGKQFCEIRKKGLKLLHFPTHVVCIYVCVSMCSFLVAGKTIWQYSPLFSWDSVPLENANSAPAQWVNASDYSYLFI